jgi:hypothetical protein
MTTTDLIKVYENTPYDEVVVYLAEKQKVYGKKWADEAWDLYDKWSSGKLGDRERVNEDYDKERSN